MTFFVNFFCDQCFQPTPKMDPTKLVVGQCYECACPFDVLDGNTVCTVCRDMVLLCHQCRTKLQFQYHCNNHMHLKHCYFTDLSSFSPDELNNQKNELIELVRKMKQVEKKKLKETKNARRTLNKQIKKLEDKLKEIRGNGSGSGGAVKSTSTSTGDDDGIAKNDPMDSSSSSSSSSSNSSNSSNSSSTASRSSTATSTSKTNDTALIPKCRTCGKKTGECAGECWGIWTTRSNKVLEH